MHSSLSIRMDHNSLESSGKVKNIFEHAIVKELQADTIHIGLFFHLMNKA